MTLATRVAGPIVVAAIAFGAYLGGVMPGVGFWDTAEFQTVLPILGTAHSPGFPTYVLIGWVANAVFAPLGEPAFRMNVLSAILVAIAAGATVVLVGRLTQRRILGLAAGIGLATTPLAWGISTHADPHALHVLLVAVLFILLVGWQDAHSRDGQDALDSSDVDPGRADRWLIAATVVFGLSVGNHSLTLLLAPPVGLYVLAVEPRIWRRGRLVATCVGVLVATVALVYLELPIRAGIFPAALVYGRPDTWDGFWYVALAEQFRGSIVDPLGSLDEKAAWLVALTVEQFGALAPLIPVAFLATVVRRPSYALLSGLAVAITVFFSASYVNADITRYYLGPTLIVWTWLGLLAAAIVDPPVRTAEARAGRSSASSGRRALIATSIVALAMLVPTAVAIPERAARADRSTDLGAGPWLDAALGAFERDAVVVSWWSYSTALWYAQHIEGRRPDIWIVDDRTRLDLDLGDVIDVIDANFGTRPIYLIREDRIEIIRLRERYVVERLGEGHLFGIHRIIARSGQTQ